VLPGVSRLVGLPLYAIGSLRKVVGSAGCGGNPPAGGHGRRPCWRQILGNMAGRFSD